MVKHSNNSVGICQQIAWVCFHHFVELALKGLKKLGRKDEGSQFNLFFFFFKLTFIKRNMHNINIKIKPCKLITDNRHFHGKFPNSQRFILTTNAWILHIKCVYSFWQTCKNLVGSYGVKVNNKYFRKRPQTLLFCFYSWPWTGIDHLWGIFQVTAHYNLFRI